MTRIFKVKYGSFTSINVVANNVKDAIIKAIKLRRKQNDNYINRVHDIDLVELLAESDE